MRRLLATRSTLIVSAVLILITAFMLPLAQLTPSVQAAGTITGSVFQDYNANGIKDIGSYTYSSVTALAIDSGIGNVTVTAYDSTGQVGTTTTAADGSYTLSHTGSGTIRVEFSGIPAGYQPGPQSGGVTPGGSPSGVVLAGSTVQFVTTTGTANLSLIRPEEYCQNNPRVAVPCYTSGDPLGGGTSGTADALVAASYTASGTSPAPTHLASNSQLGAVWGEAWQRDTKKLFTAAFVKRHIGLGTLGTGGIYVTDLSTATPTTSAYIDVKTLGIDTGSFTAARGLPAVSTTPSIDAEAFAHVGKLGLGGITLSDDGATLWLTNLNDRKLYSIAIGNPPKATAALTSADVTSYGATAPWLTSSPCTNGVARPFGVKYYRGKVYVGVVCTAESGGTRANLRAIVYALDTATSTFSTVINFSLDFQRGNATDRVPASNQWFPWTDTYSDAAFRPTTKYDGTGAAINDCCGGLQISRPMPILSDLEFDSSGALIISFGDRDSHQFGNGHPRPVASDTAVLFGTTGGDILRACLVAGSYVLESNGSCGGVSGSGVGNTEGPSGGEFYAGDEYNTPNHQETNDGGIAYLPGGTLTVMAGSDPANYNSGGLYWMSNSTGNATQRYQIYLSGNAATFGKAAGLGDAVLLCDAAPIEIGNRVWRDLDADGVQDANELGIAGATVHLYAADGTTVLATAVTDANGDYSFSSATGTNTTSAKYNIAGLTPNTSGYTIRLDNATDYAAGGPLAALVLSPANVSANSQDQRDSDATLVAGYPRIAVTTGAPGTNNHTYDVGFLSYSVGNRVWFDVNNNGLLDGGETGIASVAVSLFADANADGTPDSSTPLAVTTTDASGYYRFDGLDIGTYVVRVNPVNFQTGGPLNGRFSSTTTVATPNGDVDKDDNGIDDANQAANGILSGPITLGPGTSEPTGETDVSASGQGSADNQANMTVDFGFFEKLSVGNFVWYDTNNNGVFDAGEQPIPGVTLRLFADTDGSGTLNAADLAVGSSQTTDSGGHYLFTGLDAGNYFVQILPANYLSGGALVGYANSSGAFPGDTNNNKDHGTPAAGQGVVSERVTLSFGGEPTTDGDSDANTNLTIDFGFYHLTVGNFVWHDDNNNGQVNAGEQPFSGVRVELYDSANTLVAVTTTAANGQYLFTQQTDSAGVGSGAGLVTGDYYVKIPASQFGSGSVLAGYYSSTGNDAGDVIGDTIDNNDNGIDAANPAASGIRSVTFTLTPGGEPTVTNASGTTSNTTIDFGFYTMSLGNLVWNDANNNGVFDAGESPLESVAVNLYYDADNNGAIDNGETTAIQTTATNASGHYLFTGLVAGNYVVELATSNFDVGGLYRGYISSTGTTGSVTGPYDPAPDPDLNTADSHDNGTTAGVFTPSPYIQSGMITLVAGNEPSSTVETGGNTVTDPAPDTNSNLTVDFGLTAPVGLGNKIWIDANNNGTRDTGELDVPSGVKVNLYYDANNDGTIAGAETTPLLTTNYDTLFAGEYVFTALAPGNYMVELDPSNFAAGGPLEGYTSSTGTNGRVTGPNEMAPDPDNDVDEDDNGSVVGTLGSGGSIRSALITLTRNGEPIGETGGSAQPPSLDADLNTTLDFGVFQPASMGDFVWNDVNLNGIQDSGEAGIQGVTASLYNSADDSLVATTTTNSAGAYQIGNLAPGTYYVVFSNLPSGYVFTLQDQVGTDATDSDADPISGRTANFTLAAGANNPTIDAGAYNDTRASLGNFVWYDLNENGVQDSGEAGVSGVTVELHSGTTNALLSTTTTDTNGAYLFSNLLQGDYYVAFTPPTNYAFSPQDAGGNTAASDLIDSDANTSTGQASTTHLDPGETDSSWDAGIYYTKVALGNRVWKDTNDDGQDNGIGGGLANVTVNLYRDSNADGVPDGAIIATTTTDANGFYLFTNLDPDTYIVEVVTPTGYVSSTGASGFATGPYEPAPAPDNDNDQEDHGTDNGTVTRSTPITLSRGDQPTGEVIAQPNPDVVTPDFNSNLTVDFGFYQPLSLGDRVWHDVNDNGLLDAGESGLPGVTVKLYDAGNVLVTTTTTDASGNYLFTNLGRGTYTVEVVIPSGYVSSTDIASSANANANVDNDDNGATISGGTARSGSVTLAPNAEPADDPGQPAGNANRNPTVDFGFYQPLSLGNLVWNDANNNGVVDVGESGIDGVTVKLYRDANTNGAIDAGEFVATQTTSGGGLYLFTGLRPGSYLVELPATNFTGGGALEHFASSTGGSSEPAPSPDNDTNNDDNGTAQAGAVLSLPVTLISGAEPLTDGDSSASTNLSVDFGLYPLASLGNYVWLDSNKDGVQDVGESGLAGVTVTLYQPGSDGVAGTFDDVAVSSTTTGAGGLYQFWNLVPGNYFINVVAPLGYAFSPQDSASATDLTDSDVNTTSGFTVLTTLTPGENDLSWDAGVIFTAGLGDRVWLDQNANGIQDVGEAGVPGVTITLYTSTNTLVSSTTTNAGGNYNFPSVAPGDYYTVVTLPTDYRISPQDQGGDDAADNDANPATGRTVTTTISLGESDSTWDFGLYRPVSLGDRVWHDANDNGVLDVGETGLSGVAVKLYASDGSTEIPVGPDGVLSTGDDAPGGMLTDASGNYLFSNLPPGDYIVAVATPSGYVSSTDISSSSTPNSDIDSDDNGILTIGATTRSAIVTLITGTEPADDPGQAAGNADRNPTVDFGFYQPLSLGNLVWNDVNNNGVVDVGESGIDNVTVKLYRDANGNGLIDAGEFVATQTTSGGGLYLFPGLRPGAYIVGLPASNFASSGALVHLASSSGGNSEPATDPDNDLNNDDNGTARGSGSVVSLPVTLISGSEPTSDGDADPNTNLSVDFGFYPLASLGDYVWLDSNQNGVQDAGEGGVPGVSVKLYQPGPDDLAGTGDDVLVASTTTGANGNYQFIDLKVGNYFVQFIPPLGYGFSPQDQGADDLADSDADTTSGRTAITTLVPNENDTSWDAGLIFTAGLGDRVWLDQNANGVQDAGEPGLPGVTVTLYTSTGTQVGTPATTDANGNYAFAVPPGDYYVVVTPPAGYQLSPQNQGADDNADSDADLTTGQMATTTIALNEHDPSWDAGLYQLVSLGDLVWNDVNNNGVVDVGESGVNGVVVNLYRDANGNGQLDAGEFVTTQTTNSSGGYQFVGLVPGSYLVQLDPSNFASGGVLAGYISSTGAIGTNVSRGGPYEPAASPNNDVNDDDNGSAVSNLGVVSAPITLTSGGEPTNDRDSDPNSNLTVDFGVFLPASLGSIVWFDTDKDGVRDPGELGVPGVSVTLYDANGNAIATTTTDANGNFQFTDLAPGNYQVVFGNLPAGYIFSPQDQGGNDANDSDPDPATGETGVITLVPGQNNGTVNAGVASTAPTAITLVRFTASQEGEAVVVSWETSTEFNTAGFYLYRSADGTRGSAVRVTPQLIRGKGLGQTGAAYAWTDSNVTAGTDYAYWLQEVDLDGAIHEYGPARTTKSLANGKYLVFLPLQNK